MRICYYATLRDITHRHQELWDAPAATLGDLLDALCRKHGPAFERWVGEKEGCFGSMSIFLINGRDYRDLNGKATPLHPDDTICIFPPLAGG